MLLQTALPHSLLLLSSLLLPLACGGSMPPDTSAPGIAAELAAPFNYFLVAHDVVGFKHAPQAAQIAPDGALVTAFGELRLGLGPDGEPAEPRIRTLHDGYLPVLEYGLTRGGAAYRVQIFGLPTDLDPSDNLLISLRVTVDNPTDSQVPATVRVRWGDVAADDSRAGFHCAEWHCDQFVDPDVWEASRDIQVDGGEVHRAAHLVLRDAGAAPPEVVRAADGEAIVQRHFTLAPGERVSVDLVVPFVPVALDRPGPLADVRDADYDARFAAAAAFWEQELHQGTVVRLDEPKVVDTMRASLAYDLIARDVQADGSVVQHVGELMHARFYSRDAAYMTRTYDLLGRHDLARETAEHFVVLDPGGQPARLLRDQPDDWGQSLWALGTHARATGDAAWAMWVQPAIGPHLDAFEEAIASDPLGLWPEAGGYDNELIEGHYTGHNLWALLGLREAEDLLARAGDAAAAARARSLYDAHLQRFLTALAAMTDVAGGYVTPGLDDPREGFDWANASGGVYPFGVFAPDDPRVDATMALLRPHRYQEGIMTYGGVNAFRASELRAAGEPVPLGTLHHYETMYVTQTLLARGDQRAVLEDFYAVLAHTGSAHGGFEWTIPPWGDRDPTWNRPPHGWFAARYNELLRNMLLREDGDRLHLLSAVSPQWLAPGKTLEVERGATDFGSLDLNAAGDDGGATVSLTPDWRDPPAAIVLHAPFWVTMQSAAATDTRGAALEVEVAGGAVTVPAEAREIRLDWAWNTPPELSYQATVERYLTLYYDRPDGADTHKLLSVE